MISQLTTYTAWSPNHSGERNAPIDRITPHCTVGYVSMPTLGTIFGNPKRQASSNYGIGKSGEIAAFVDENNRSWCSSNSANDNRAVTIECASDSKPPYTVTNATWIALTHLCLDICIRYDKRKLIWINNRCQALAYRPFHDEMLITVHRWFANKSCPGDFIFGRLGTLADDVTVSLTCGTPVYTVQQGDTLWSIARTWYGVGGLVTLARVNAIRAKNGLSGEISAGDRLFLPL